MITNETIIRTKEQIDYKNILINYFDLGVRSGWELDQFLNFCRTHQINYNAYGFEASARSFQDLKEKYTNVNNVHIYNMAVTNVDNQTIKLYHTQDPDGNSIFDTKYNLLNINENFEFCSTIKLSSFVNNIHKDGNVINIIKANIEGAEYHVIKDLQQTNKLDYFDYYIGAGWTTDMEFVDELKDKVDEIKTIFEENNIETYYFARGRWQRNNINFDDLIHS